MLVTRVALRGVQVVGLGLAVIGLTGCTAPSSIRIDEIDYATQFSQNGPHADISLYWSGSPAFPVTVTTVPTAHCSQGPYSCSPASTTFSQASQPLVWKGISYCSGNTPTTNAPWVISYDMRLTDAAGHHSAAVRLAQTCYFGSAPIRFAAVVLHDQPWITQVLRPVTDVSWKLVDVSRSVALALGLIFLIAFPSQLFNSTLQSHYEEVTGWFRWVPRPRRREGGRAPRWLLVLVFLLGGVLGSLLDPHWAFDGTTLEAIAGILLASAFTTALYSFVRARFLRSVTGLRGYFRVYGTGIAVAAVCVLVSRLTQAQPGYLYGVLLGHTLGAGAPKLARHHEGRSAALGAGTVLAVSVLIWLLWTPVKALTESTDAFPLVILSTAMAGVFLGGMTSLVFGLLPLRWLDGEKLLAWRRALWAGLAVVAMFLFIHVVMNNAAGTQHQGRNLVVTVVLFCLFGAVSTAFWAYFRFRPEPSAKPLAPAPAP